MQRRTFLKQSLAASAAGIAAVHVSGSVAKAAPQERVRVAVMGLGRGASLAESFARLPNAEVAYLCDLDERRSQPVASKLEELTGKRPQMIHDFRDALDDKAVDALVVASPDHWHAPAAILACKAGKHVYCEKPCSHNPQEGEWLVEAARKYGRQVQHGTQRRSSPLWQEAVRKVQDGAIGKVLLARAWYCNPRPSIGKGQEAPVPEWLDWSLWQGPAPERKFRDNLVHYNWHWFWHWGTAELGNNGVHMIDICRQALGVEYPKRVTCLGGRYAFDDDQETPETAIATFDFGDKAICWEGRSYYRKRKDDPATDVAFYGTEGSLTIAGGTYVIYDFNGKEVARNTGSTADTPHIENFVAAITSGAPLNAQIEEGHKTVLLCHLGNIAYRTGHTIDFDAKTRRIVDDPAASALWGREYRPGWEPSV